MEISWVSFLNDYYNFNEISEEQITLSTYFIILNLNPTNQYYTEHLLWIRHYLWRVK